MECFALLWLPVNVIETHFLNPICTNTPLLLDKLTRTALFWLVKRAVEFSAHIITVYAVPVKFWSETNFREFHNYELPARVAGRDLGPEIHQDSISRHATEGRCGPSLTNYGCLNYPCNLRKPP